MNGFLLDTNTVSELVSVKPNQRVLDWLDAADENRLYLSAMTLGEIRRGVAASPNLHRSGDRHVRSCGCGGPDERPLRK